MNDLLPIDLLGDLPGAQPLAREAGFSLQLEHPTVDREPSIRPPGQGRLLVPIRGSAHLRELLDPSSKVLEIPRPARDVVLQPGRLSRVANDARWSLAAGQPDARVLTICTSVPREVDRDQDLRALARRRHHVAPRLLFAGEAVRLELVAARGRLPLRGWMPGRRVRRTVEYAAVLEGCFRGTVEAGEARWSGRLPEGSLLRIPGGARAAFRPATPGLCVALVITPTLDRIAPDRLDRSAARGFSPFVRE
jgi:hypothetical protein